MHRSGPSTSSIELIRIDCLEWMASQGAGQVDCVVTSPPYNLGIDYGGYDDVRPRDEYLEWLERVFVAIKRVLTQEGQLFLNVGNSNQDPWISSDVANVARQQFVLQNRISWVKSITVDDTTFGHFKPINSHRFLSPTNEEVFHFTKTGTVEVDKLSIGVPYEDKSNLNKEARARGRIVKKMGFENWRQFNATAGDEQRRRLTAELEERVARIGDVPDRRCRGNTWFIPYETIRDRANQRGQHPATFPVKLAEMCISFAGIPPGSLVYDPFVGTGSTMVAALEFKMRGVGTDVDADYLDYAARRLDDVSKGQRRHPALF